MPLKKELQFFQAVKQLSKASITHRDNCSVGVLHFCEALAKKPMIIKVRCDGAMHLYLVRCFY